MIELHTSATGNGAKPLLVLEELAFPYRLHILDLSRGEHKSPAHLALHPAGRIPVLHDQSNGLVLFESLAIVLYLCEKTARLLPLDPVRRAQAQQWMAYVATNLEPRAMVIRRASREGRREQLPAGFLEEFKELLQVLDASLETRAYFAHEFTAADLFCYPFVFNLFRQEPDVRTQLPHLAAWATRLAERDTVRATYERLGIR